MKIIFLDFDGVMDTAYYDMVLVSKGLQEVDEYGVIFDPACIKNLETIIKNTKADIVVTSSWKYLMSYENFLEMWNARNLPGFVTENVKLNVNMLLLMTLMQVISMSIICRI